MVAPLPNTTQSEPRLVLGRNGTVLAYWSDSRWHDGFSDLYGQLLTPLGGVAAAWPDTGLMISRANDSQRPDAGLAHPDGSFLVGVGDWRNFVAGGTSLDMYLTRVLPNGSIDPAWPRHGFQAVNRPRPDDPQYMLWVAPDTLVMSCGVTGPDSYNQLLFQQVAITPSGPQLPWGSSGVVHAWRPHGAFSTLSLVADGAGGLFVLFDEVTSDDVYVDPQADLYLMRIGRDGQPASGWEAGARPVCLAPGVQEFGVLRSDGAGGLYAVWADARDGSGQVEFHDYENIRLLRMTSEGAPYPGWPADGLLVSDAPGWQFLPALEPDGHGGVYVAWQDVNFLGLTRVRGDGTFAPGWGKNGLAVSTLFAYSSHAKLVLDNSDGVYVLFVDVGQQDLYLQHMRSSGVVDPLWPATGILVTAAPGDGDIVPDGTGGCYVAYQTQLAPFTPPLVAVNRFGIDGVVPVKLAEATAEAEPGRVHLVWRGAEGRAADTRVQRRNESGGYWRDLGAPVARGRDELEYDDLTAEAGAGYAYRLIRGAEVLSQEVTVRVPATAVFALAGATPNPALAHELSAAFSLTGAGSATLEVLDLAGRREYVRTLSGLAPGRHTLPLAEARLAPGVHWLHLSEASREATARMIVVR